MNKKNETYLYNNFPVLYRGMTLPISQSNMAFGLECRDGWFDIIDELSKKLEPLDVVASQVKEKYGTLRFYIHSGTDEAYDLIDEAEAKSEETCELCGAPGELRGAGWVTTMCDECYKGEDE